MKKNLVFIMLMQALTYATSANSKDYGQMAISKVDFSISELDTDRDGNISLQEYLAADVSNTEMIYRHLDQNSDGILDAEEQAAIEAVYQGMHEQQVKSNSI